MGDSLQDQLRALGLAQSRRAAEQRKQQPSRKAKRQGQNKGSKSAGELSLDQAYALREREERRQAERARQQKLEEDRRRRELNKAIREIVSAGRKNREDAEIARNFMFNGRIRKVYVTAEQQQALSMNELGIVYLAGSYHLLGPDSLEAVRRISAKHVVDLSLATDEDDPEHPVPDDLIW
jgi:uncharacterized protein YaiL (DUF2058 family)